jgi:hypothetical protein
MGPAGSGSSSSMIRCTMHLLRPSDARNHQIRTIVAITLSKHAALACNIQSDQLPVDAEALVLNSGP